MKTKFLYFIIIIASHIGYSQVFYDDVSKETIGDFPSKWDVITGMATVDNIEGFNTIGLQHGSIIKPIVNNQTNHYINGDFIIEFDAFFGKTSSIYGQRIIIRLWNGKYSYKQDDIRYNPFIIKRNGISTSWLQPESGNAENFFKDLHTLEPIWRHIKIICKNNKLQIFLDNKLILNLPRFKMQPTMVSVGGAINDSKYDAKVGVTNFRITSSLTKTQIGETEKNLSTNASINNSNITTPIIGNPTPNIEENIITTSQENNNSNTNSGAINQIKFNRNISGEAHQKMEELLPKGIQSFSFSPNGGWVIITKDNKHFARNIPQQCYEKIKEYVSRGIKIKEVVFPPKGGDNSWLIITENDTYARNIPQECYKKIQAFKQQGKKIQSVSFPYKNIYNNSYNAWVILTTDGQFYTRNIPDECYQIMRNIRQTDMPNKPSDRKISKVSFSPSGGWTILADDYFFSRNIPEEAFKKLGEFRSKGYNNSILAFDPDKNGWSIVANKRIKAIPSNKIRAFEQNVDSSKSIWKIMRERKIPGISVAVVINGEIAWKTSYGHLIANDKRYAAHPESMFQAASISKVFAAVGVFKLIDDNKVTLTENLLTSRKLKSNIPFNSCVKDSSWVRNFNEVTIENILQHRSGIEGRGAAFNSNCNYKGRKKGGGYGGYENLHSLPNLTTLLKNISITYHPTKMVLPPNNKSNWYSGKAFTVLQKLTEDITSNNYPSWMKSNILDPLNMKKSGFVINPENKYGEFSRAHNEKGEKVKVLRFPQYAAAGLYTSSEELANLIIMINNDGVFKGNRILSKSAITNLVDNHMGVNTRSNRFSHGGTNPGGFKAFFTGIRNINSNGIKNAGIIVLTNGTDQYIDNNNDNENDLTEIRYLITNRIRNVYGW